MVEGCKTMPIKLLNFIYLKFQAHVMLLDKIKFLFITLRKKVLL